MTITERIESLYKQGVNNPSGIVSILFLHGEPGRYTEMRKIVIKELQRLNSEDGQAKRNENKF